MEAHKAQELERPQLPPLALDVQVEDETSSLLERMPFSVSLEQAITPVFLDDFPFLVGVCYLLNSLDHRADILQLGLLISVASVIDIALQKVRERAAVFWNLLTHVEWDFMLLKIELLHDRLGEFEAVLFSKCLRIAIPLQLHHRTHVTRITIAVNSLLLHLYDLAEVHAIVRQFSNLLDALQVRRARVRLCEYTATCAPLLLSHNGAAFL